MNPIVLSKGLLNPNLNVSLYTVPKEYSYMYCSLILTAADGNGMAFTAWATLQAIVRPQDTVAFYPTATGNPTNTAFNNFTKKGLLVGPGETIYLYTQQNDISYRLTGYGVPIINNTGLNLPNAVENIR